MRRRKRYGANLGWFWIRECRQRAIDALINQGGLWLRDRTSAFMYFLRVDARLHGPPDESFSVSLAAARPQRNGN